MSKQVMKKYLGKDKIKFIESKNKTDAIKELWTLIKEEDKIVDSKKLLMDILNREKIMSTGIGVGVAVPHIKSNGVKDFVIVIGISKRGIDYDAIDKKNVHIIVMIAAPAHKHDEYLKLLAKLVLRLKNNELRNKIVHSKTVEDVYTLFTK